LHYSLKKSGNYCSQLRFTNGLYNNYKICSLWGKEFCIIHIYTIRWLSCLQNVGIPTMLWHKHLTEWMLELQKQIWCLLFAICVGIFGSIWGFLHEIISQSIQEYCGTGAACCWFQESYTLHANHVPFNTCLRECILISLQSAEQNPFNL